MLPYIPCSMMMNAVMEDSMLKLAHVSPSHVLWKGNVIATVFEPQNVAYKPYSFYNEFADSLIGVALPCRIPDSLRKVLYVSVRYKDQLLFCKIVDVGPWFTTDAYFLQRRRPRIESECYDERGRKVTNRAALDLTKAAAEWLGFTGNDEVELMIYTYGVPFVGDIVRSSAIDACYRIGITDRNVEVVFVNCEGYTLGFPYRDAIIDREHEVLVYYRVHSE